MIILRRDVIHVMRDALERLVGEQAAPFLSYLASGIGIHEGSIFRDSIATSGPEQRAELENLVHSAFEDTNLGLGRVKIRAIDFDMAKASVAISNCFEALENGASDDPNCMFTSGFLAGLFAEVLDKTVQAKETKCMSQGQPECEFEISLADAEERAIDAESEKAIAPEQEIQKSKPSTAPEKPASTPKLSANKPAEKPSTLDKEQPTQSQKLSTPVNQPSTPAQKPSASANAPPAQAQNATPSQPQSSKSADTADRIEKRKQGFWEKHFNKKK